MENSSDPLRDPLHDRLTELRDEAKRRGRVDAPGTSAAGGPMPGYHGQPVLKAPVWTWEVPTYFFVGGVAGAAAAIAFVATMAGAEAALARDARFIALAGALLSPPLLISDLGRPSRFLNMLRVAKRQSAMSVGAWTLVAFSISIAASVLLHLIPVAVGPLGYLIVMADASAAVTGLVLATYTGVLLGVTAIPVWAAHARTLPVDFAASSLGAAVSMLELAGHMTPELNFIGRGAALLVVLDWIYTESTRSASSRPLHTGSSAALVRLSHLLAGVIPFALRLAPSAPALRAVAALATIAGSLLARFGWIAAGRASAADPGAALNAGTRP